MLTLDHLVVAAGDLASGRAWVEGLLGAPMEPGGRHETFGTHNAVLSLGPSAYLEVIAIDPAAPAPARPRWFELDSQAMRERLAGGPALIHWVVAVPSLSGDPEALELSRGPNRWTLTVAADGRMPLGGLAPSRLHWHTPPPPTSLPDRRIRLEVLELRASDPDAVRVAVVGVDAPVLVTTGGDRIRASLRTPRGRVTLPLE